MSWTILLTASGPGPMSPDNRPSVYLENGRPIYRGSSVGYCKRMLGAARLGYTPLAKKRGLALAADAGQRLESLVVEELEQQGWIITDRQQEYEIKLPALTIRMHIDGMATKKKFSSVLLEIKTMNDQLFEKYKQHGLKAFPKYEAQLVTYLKATMMPLALYVVRNRVSGSTIVRPTSPNYFFEEIKQRLLDVELAARKSQLLPPECTEQSDHYLCQYNYLCEEVKN